jgi:tungstate transport system substrate-binding protein
MMATTTSTDNTGLLDVLAKNLKKEKGIELRWTAVGTGKALQMGRDCNVDVVLTHDPEAEDKFVADGAGINKTQLMYNDFIIVGPKNDPAGIRKKSVVEALKIINEKKAVFTSRGDKSGTHMLEQRLWKSAGLAVPEKETWYMETGQGMIETITIAAEKGGYTLADRGTFIKYESTLKGKPGAVILVEKDQALFNQYSAIEVNPAKCPKARNDLAKAYIDWMKSPKTQRAIGNFKLMKKPLFTPNAKK